MSFTGPGISKIKEAAVSAGKAFCIAFSIFSKIPMPHFEWDEKEIRYQLVFFPWVGIVIGALLILWRTICGIEALGIVQFAYVCIGIAIPILVTGGFHIDGYMDVMDAIKSYQPKERKLEILKDPHIGAFAVIMLAAVGLIYAGAFSQIAYALIPSFAGSFFVSRSLSGIAVLTFPQARKKGMVRTFSDSAKEGSQKTVLIVLLAEMALGVLYMIIMCPLAGVLMSAAAALVFFYYKYKCVKEFGGITGDTAGFFVTVCETAMAVAAAIATILI